MSQRRQRLLYELKRLPCKKVAAFFLSSFERKSRRYRYNVHGTYNLTDQAAKVAIQITAGITIQAELKLWEKRTGTRCYGK